MQENYDVIVVGGGPAGAATATYLAQAGRSVLLLERATFPRDKPCGEFLSPPVRGLLDELGAYPAVLAAGARPVPGARIHCANGQTFAGQYAGGRQSGLSIERMVFDQLLFENARAAGVNACEGVAVRGVLRERGRITGVQTDAGAFRAPVTVGADGGRSRVAREMGVVRPLLGLQKIALVGHYADVPLETDHPVEMHLHISGAVCGFGPGPGATADVTLVVDETEARCLAAAGPAAYYDAVLSRFPEISQRLRLAQRTRLATCGTFGHTTRTPIADGSLLVGDAATFIDPFTGEGVYFALRGAQMASETVLAALVRGDTSARALRPYARARQREFAPKYAVCGLIQRIVHSPAWMQYLAPRFARQSALADQLLAVTGDLESPYRLLSPSYALRILTG